MLFLPLGLFTKIFRLPWVTAFIVIGTIFFSYRNFPAVEEAEKNFLRSERQHEILQTKLRMLALLCEPQSLLHHETCQAVSEMSDGKVSSLMQPFQEIEKRIKNYKWKNEDLLKVSQYLFKNDLVEKHRSQLSGTAPYQEWLVAQAAYDQESKALFQKNNLLSKGNLNVISALKAQFIHGGYMHLFGNLLFFVFLSIFVELRLGAILYSIFYLATGTVGLLSEIWWMTSLSIPLVGASANIAGIAGAFTVFFWKKRMKVFASAFFVYNRILALPVYFFFPVLVFSGDLVGSLNPNPTGVAHIAHMGGFLFGAALAYLLKTTDRLPAQFSFEEEFFQFQKISRMPREDRTRHFVHLLRINPENSLVHQRILNTFTNLMNWETLGDLQKKYISEELPSYILFEKNNTKLLFHILTKANGTWPLKTVLKGLTASDLKRLLTTAEQAKFFHGAHLLMETLFLRFPKLKEDPVWKSHQEKILANLPRARGSFDQSA